MRRRPSDANRGPAPKLGATRAIALSRFIVLTTGVFDEPSILRMAQCARYLSAEAGMEVPFHCVFGWHLRYLGDFSYFLPSLLE